MTYDEWCKRIFVAALHKSNELNRHDLNLYSVAKEAGLSVNNSWVQKFEHDLGHYGSRYQNRFTDFEITAQGLLLARDFEREFKNSTLRGRIAAIPVGKGVWDIIKIGLGGVLGYFVKSHFG